MRENISFPELITYYSICIPEIQRDYAQGRTDDKTTEIRNHFLEDMFSVLFSENTEPLILDFVYGSTDENKVFIPLDGQQRLTTLYLLHWYLLPKGVQNNLQKFTYAARISSRDFCHELTEHSLTEIKSNIKDNLKDGNWKLSYGIKNESWFLWSWRKDPTITGMLSMLDAIDEKLKEQTDLSHLWENLSKNKRIVFHLLPLEEFDLTDELYVKMNARGKELSPFDILKSTFEEQMKINKVCDTIQEEWKTNVDSKWMDLFWNKKAVPYLINNDNEEDIVEKVETYYLRFLKRMMFFHLFMIDDFEKPDKLDKEQFDEGIKSVREFVRGHDIITIVPKLEKCGFFNESFFSFVINTMNQILYNEDNKIKEGSEFINTSFWGIDNQAVNNLFDLFVGEEVTYLGHVLFFAQLQFFKYHSAENILNSDMLKEELNNWIRVIRNLAYNTGYNDADEFRNTLKSLEELAFNVYSNENESKSILGYLTNNENIGRFTKEQIEEEQEKAGKLINADKDLREKIINLENYSFFKGAIRFSFRVGIDENGKNIYNWDYFEFRANKSELYFDKNGNGVSEKYRNDSILLRMLICSFTKMEQFCGCTFDNNASSWRDILLNRKWIVSLNFIFENEPIGFDYVNHNFSHENQDSQLALIHYDLCKSDLLNHITSGCKLNRRNDQYVLYPYNTRSKRKIYVIGNKRNKIFSQLVKENKIEIMNNGECGKLENIPYFWGWYIHFNCKDARYYFDVDDSLSMYNIESDSYEIIKEVTLEKIEAYFKQLL